MAGTLGECAYLMPCVGWFKRKTGVYPSAGVLVVKCKISGTVIYSPESEISFLLNWLWGIHGHLSVTHRAGCS